jgi:heat-inducible transcriptional repressor
MLILVMDGYQTQSVVMDFPQSILGTETNKEENLEEELQIISNFLNNKLKGRSLAEFSSLDWQEIDQDFAQYASFLRTLLKQLNCCLKSQDTPAIMIHGVSEVLRQPEFSHLQQVQMLLHLLEQEQDQLFPLIFESPETEPLTKGVTIRIGTENPLESMRPCTLISAVYRQGDIPVGSVGIIGPTRMIYENTIPLVESTADYLSDALS